MSLHVRTPRKTPFARSSKNALPHDLSSLDLIVCPGKEQVFEEFQAGFTGEAKHSKWQKACHRAMNELRRRT